MNTEIYREIDLLKGSGATITIRYKKKQITSKLKFIKTTVEKTFVIEEPTLFTLDAITSELIKIDESFSKLEFNDVLKDGITFTSQNLKRAAKIIAIAILGNGHNNEIKLKKTERFFYRHFRPSDISNIFDTIVRMLNLEGFILSIRLISTQKGDLVEGAQ